MCFQNLKLSSFTVCAIFSFKKLLEVKIEASRSIAFTLMQLQCRHKFLG